MFVICFKTIIQFLRNSVQLLQFFSMSAGLRTRVSGLRTPVSAGLRTPVGTSRIFFFKILTDFDMSEIETAPPHAHDELGPELA